MYYRYTWAAISTWNTHLCITITHGLHIYTWNTPFYITYTHGCTFIHGIQMYILQIHKGCTFLHGIHISRLQIHKGCTFLHGIDMVCTLMFTWNTHLYYYIYTRATHWLHIYNTHSILFTRLLTVRWLVGCRVAGWQSWLDNLMHGRYLGCWNGIYKSNCRM